MEERAETTERADQTKAAVVVSAVSVGSARSVHSGAVVVTVGPRSVSSVFSVACSIALVVNKPRRTQRAQRHPLFQVDHTLQPDALARSYSPPHSSSSV